VQYVLAGASLVAMGTAAMQEPRLPQKVIRDLEKWCRHHDVKSLMDLRGAVQWES
jgi:dihydroorotate dehydrogenase (NAD+) catalytic subunit